MKDESDNRPSFMRFHAGTIVLLGFILAAVVLSRMDGGVKRHFPSPDGRHVATISVTHSDMTTGDYADLTLRRPGKWMGGSAWDVLWVGPGRRDPIQVGWVASDKLSVTYKSYEEWTAPAPTNIDGVTITFKHDDLGYSSNLVEMERDENSPTDRVKR